MNIETIKKNEEFRRIYNTGKSQAGAFVVLYRVRRKDEHMRFGITVSKKVGNAVCRNRVRRLIKEAIRHNDKLFSNEYDYIFVARVRSKTAKLVDIERNIRYLLSKFRKNVKK